MYDTQFVSLATLVCLLVLRVSGTPFDRGTLVTMYRALGGTWPSGDGDSVVIESAGRDESHANATDECPCQAIWNPVCGTNDRTYWNEECAKCAGVDIACHGRCSCDHSCDCPDVDRPVCGVDHVTYRNNCWANCKRMPPRCYGRCPCACLLHFACAQSVCPQVLVRRRSPSAI